MLPPYNARPTDHDRVALQLAAVLGLPPAVGPSLALGQDPGGGMSGTPGAAAGAGTSTPPPPPPPPPVMPTYGLPFPPPMSPLRGAGFGAAPDANTMAAYQSAAAAAVGMAGLTAGSSAALGQRYGNSSGVGPYGGGYLPYTYSPAFGGAAPGMLAMQWGAPFGYMPMLSVLSPGRDAAMAAAAAAAAAAGAKTSPGLTRSRSASPPAR